MTQIHDLRGLSADSAYDETQINDGIKHGDVLLVDGAVAVLDLAWPCIVVGEHDSFHEVMPTSTWLNVLDDVWTPERRHQLQEGLLLAWAVACG